MAVPADILAVKRPLNTVVVDHGGSGRKRFAVLARKESVPRPGRSSSPRNGKVVGHIIGGKYVPLDSMSLAAQGAVSLSYGISALLYKLMADVFRELLDVYSINDALSIMVLIDAKIRRPNVSIIEVQEVFRSSYASVYWRGAPVSKNSLYSLITRLGESYYRRLNFCKLHIANLSIKDQLVVLDEAHRRNPTEEDLTLADYTLRPQRYDEFEKHDFFTLYAYSADLGEPVCLDTYLGDYDEITVPGVASLIEKYGLASALIFNDGQFTNGKITALPKDTPGLHYLLSTKGWTNFPRKYKERPYDGEFDSKDGFAVFYWKERLSGKKYLYAFRGVPLALKEKVQTGIYALFDEKINIGVEEDFWIKVDCLEFVSDLDISPSEVYLAYIHRQVVKLAVGHYIKYLNPKRSYSQFPLQGSGFIDFLCSLASCRIVNFAHKTGLLSELPYGYLLKTLEQTWRTNETPVNQLPRKNDPYWGNTDPEALDVLETLGLCEKKIPKKEKIAEKRKRGRPRKNPEQNALEVPKRPRGRPRKNLEPNA